jgi:hypothetical protein
MVFIANAVESGIPWVKFVDNFAPRNLAPNLCPQKKDPSVDDEEGSF